VYKIRNLPKGQEARVLISEVGQLAQEIGIFAKSVESASENAKTIFDQQGVSADFKVELSKLLTLVKKFDRQ